MHPFLVQRFPQLIVEFTSCFGPIGCIRLSYVSDVLIEQGKMQNQFRIQAFFVCEKKKATNIDNGAS